MLPRVLSPLPCLGLACFSISSFPAAVGDKT